MVAGALGFSSFLHKNGAHPRRENFHFLLTVSHTQIDEIKYQFFTATANVFFFAVYSQFHWRSFFATLVGELTEILNDPFF